MTSTIRSKNSTSILGLILLFTFPALMIVIFATGNNMTQSQVSNTLLFGEICALVGMCVLLYRTKK
jgi:F0F1-type ATP synthase assembly protein I